MKVSALPVPKEDAEQKVVAAHLDNLGVLWCHVPNGSSMYGGRNDGARIRKNVHLKEMGVKAGFPDIIIFTPPPNMTLWRGAVIEMKRKKDSKVSPAQKQWLADLESYGWFTAVCKGAGEAIEQLKKWGYK